MVKLRSDQERVKALLKETITLLCKNGLEYKTRFCVDALIGITLDEEDVFMVKISETISDRGLNNNTNGDPAPLNFSVSSQSASPPHEPQTLPPVHDVQPVQDSHHLQSNVSPPATANSTSHRPSPAPRKQANPQPLSLTQNRKRRASSSPMRHVEKPENDCEQKSNDIPQQSVVTTGAISNVSELSNQSSTPSDPEPITVEPMSPEDGHSNLINKSASDIENDPSVQDAPLNFSKSSHDKKDDASCSSWDPSRIQQQVAQAAAASYASGPDVKSTESLPVKSEPPTIDGSPATSEQMLAAGYLQLSTHLNTTSSALRDPSTGMFECPICTKPFTVKGSMMRHIDTVHNPMQQRWTCPQCFKTTGTRDSLQRHIRRVHNRIFKHHCQFCGRGFHTQVDLKGHLAYHTNRKEFVCGECGRQFSHMKSLRVHRLQLNHDVPMHNHPSMLYDDYPDVDVDVDLGEDSSSQG